MAGEGVKRKIGEIIAGKKGDGFITSIVACVSNNPALSICDNGTILSAGLQGAALDLSPSPALGHFYMVPFEDKKNKRMVATFLIGYKGYIQLAIRSGQYRHINVIALKDGELINYNRLTEEIFTKLIDDDEIRDKTPTTGYYAMFELTNGFTKTMYWSKAKMKQHADKYSQAFNLETFRKIEAGEIPKGDLWKREYSSFWYQDFDGMAFKTMLRQLLSKWGVMSIELQRAFESDMSVLNQDGRPDYIDNPPDDGIDGGDQGAGNGQDNGRKAKPVWTDEAFQKALPNWLKLIADKKKTPEDAIAAMGAKNPLTEDQIKTIKAGAQPANQTDADKLIDKMRASVDVDALDVHADLIGTLPEADRENANAIYKARRAELQEGK